MKRLFSRRWLGYVMVMIMTALVVAPVSAGTTPRFTDVPNTNIFFGDIQWMADNGITFGCGTDIFCPKDTVTREQMSAFMRRLATTRVVDAATATRAESANSALTATRSDEADYATLAGEAVQADNAGRLEGYRASDYQPAATLWSPAPGAQTVLTGGSTSLGEVDFFSNDSCSKAYIATATGQVNNMNPGDVATFSISVDGVSNGNSVQELFDNNGVFSLQVLAAATGSGHFELFGSVTGTSMQVTNANLIVQQVEEFCP